MLKQVFEIIEICEEWFDGSRTREDGRCIYCDRDTVSVAHSKNCPVSVFSKIKKKG
jgi:hypothetical protein